jgi:hypothetical protein
MPYAGSSYVGTGRIIDVLRLDRARRLVFLLRDEPVNGGKTARAHPRSACIRVYTIGCGGVWWPQAQGFHLPLERVADIEASILKLRIAADRMLDKAAVALPTGNKLKSAPVAGGWDGG